MTILVTLAKDCWIAGVKQSAGSSINVDRSLAGSLISGGIAIKPADWDITERGNTMVSANPAGTALVVDGTTILNLDAIRISDGYFCHLFAKNQENSDSAAYDLSGSINHAAFAESMTTNIAWAAAGYVSTDNGGNNRVFRMPAINLDYAGGESFLLLWKGRGTPPASYKGFIGDSPGSSTAGWAVRVTTGGIIQMYFSGGGSGIFSDPTPSAAMEAATTHTYAIAVDGVTRKHTIQVDGVVTRTLSAFGAGVSKDTRTVLPVGLGSTEYPTSYAANIIASSTQALIILRGRTGLGLPANVTELMQAMHRDPSRLVRASEW